jgi:hypothetical protein
MFIGQLPVSVEYYIEERLGYELQVSILRDPFFTSASKVEVNKVCTAEVGMWHLSKNIYHPEGSFGMFYFGHEVQIDQSAKHFRQRN